MPAGGAGRAGRGDRKQGAQGGEEEGREGDVGARGGGAAGAGEAGDMAPTVIEAAGHAPTAAGMRWASEGAKHAPAARREPAQGARAVPR